MSGPDQIPKFTAGQAYGPILSQTDLYLLKIELELHPLLAGKDGKRSLVFNIASGQTAVLVGDEETPFSVKEEPATIPRVTHLAIVTQASPWCTPVTNPLGVTLSDVCSALYRDYAEMYATDEEIAQLPVRVQEAIRRMAALNASQQHGGYYQPNVAPAQFRRSEWLRERVYFDHMEADDKYMQERLGYKAPNLFRLELSTV